MPFHAYIGGTPQAVAITTDTLLGKGDRSDRLVSKLDTFEEDHGQLHTPTSP
jgi:hypothetical protein